jgi:hypothetical protein
MNPLDDIHLINFVPKALPELEPEAKANREKTGDFVASTDEESFSSDNYDTREEAVLCFPEEMGLEEGELFFVAEKREFIPTVDGDRVIENAYEEACENVGEVADGWLDGVKKGDRELLTDMLTGAFNRWLRETNNFPHFYACENVTEHRAPAPPPEPQLDMFDKKKPLPGRLNLDLGRDDRFEL